MQPNTRPSARLVRTLAIMGLGLAILAFAAYRIGVSSATPMENFRIIGYEPSWVSSRPIRYEMLTHLNYAFLLANEDGSLKTTSLDIPRMQTILKEAKAKGVKVLISVGGANNKALSVAATRARPTLIANLKTFMDEHGFDGIDIDWEGPANQEEGEAYLDLVRTLYTDLHPRGKLVTTAVGTWFGKNVPNKSFEYLDFVMLMSYDDDGLEHSTYRKAESDLRIWQEKGLPKSKTVVGVPFYGYNEGGRPVWAGTAYKDIVAQDPSAAQKDFAAGYGYNGIPTIQRKTQLALESASGIMFWELSQDSTDDTSLLNAIYKTVYPNSK